MAVLQKKKTFLDVFPPPEFLLLSTSGIALSDKAARFIQFRRGSFSNRQRLHRFGKSVLPIGAVESGYIREPEKVVKSLSELASKHGVRFVRASLPDEKAYLFTSTIDNVPKHNLRDAVAFIIEENVPVSLEKAIFDFNAVETSDPGRLKVTVSVVHRKVIEAYTSVFEAAGITVVAYDIESQAIARAIMTPGDKSTTLIVSAGEKKASFYVVENEVVQFSATPAQDVLTQAASLNIRELKNEMRKTFTYWNTRVDSGSGGDNKIERILFCGSAVSKRESVTNLAEEFGVDYSIADPWVNTSPPASGSQIVPESLEYVAAIGLALIKE